MLAKTPLAQFQVLVIPAFISQDTYVDWEQESLTNSSISWAACFKLIGNVIYM